MNEYLLKIWEYIKPIFDKYKYVLLICLMGIVLMIIAGVTQESTDSDEAIIKEEYEEYDVTDIEKAIEKLFSKIEGVGDIDIKIMLKSGFEKVYAYDTSESYSYSGNNYSSSQQKEMIFISSNGTKTPITLTIKQPEFWGAVIVCEGGDSSQIKLELTQAMKSLTGISADNITVTKMKK